MKKSTKYICIISGILFGPAALYLFGATFLPAFGMEYRFWVDCLGKTLWLMVIPLWIIGLGIRKLWQHFHDSSLAKWLIKALGVLAAVAYMFWFFLACLFIAYNTKKENDLGGGMVAVSEERFLDSTYYYPNPYRYVGPFFRKESALTAETALDYLTEKYDRVFFQGTYADAANYEDEVMYFRDSEHPDVVVKVKFARGAPPEDDYPQMLADHYLREGYETLGINRQYRLIKTAADREQFCMVMNGREDSAALAEDAYELVQYVMEQDSLLKKYDVCLYFATATYEDEYGRLEFGGHNSWEDLSDEEYGSNLAKITQHIIWSYDAMRLRALYENQEKQGGQSAADSSAGVGVSALTPTPEPTPQLTEREMAEGEYPDECRAAEAIWNDELKDLGYEYEPGFNAKGNLVIWLGKQPADNLQSTTAESDYYLTYDRVSKNGSCYLFVLSEVPEGYGLNNAYLREFYACEMTTLKVVAGNKTGWAQVGTAEYREITGE